jgi:hypothetical protein
MKKIFAYFGYVLSVVLLGALTACNPQEVINEDTASLSIKTFFPAKVVTNQPMTVSGNGMDGVREVIFPGGVSVTGFEHVGDGMIRLTAPAGIAADGGPLTVRTAEEEAVSRFPLTVGNPVVTGFSKHEGETIEFGELFYIYGKDLEFLSSLELLDADGNPNVIPESLFYRKGTSSVVVKIPQNTFEGTFPGKVNSIDGKSFAIPEMTYAPPAGGGHWEHQEVTVFDEETVFDGWSATLVVPAARFADVVEGAIIRVNYKDRGSDFNPIYKHVGSWGDWDEFQSLIAHGDGYFESTVTAAVMDELKSEGLRFQGLGFTVTSVVLIQDVWVEEGEDDTPKETTIWEQETVFDGWSVSFVIDPSMFAKAKEGYIVRVFIKDKGDDYNPIYKHVDSWGDWSEFQDGISHTDEYFQAPIPSGALDELQSAGLRFQGIGFTVTKVMLLPV